MHVSTMSRACVTGLIVLVLGHYPSLRAQEPAPGDELSQHLATLKGKSRTHRWRSASARRSFRKWLELSIARPGGLRQPIRDTNAGAGRGSAR